MEIRYDVSLGDIIEFNLFHVEHSKTVKKQVMLIRILVPVVYILLGVAFSLIWDNIFYAITFAVLSVVWFLIYKSIYRARVKKSVVKMLGEDKNRGMIGPKVLRLEGGKLSYESETSATEFKGKFVNRVLESETCYYLYTTSINAVVVPKSAFESKAQESEFVEKIEAFVDHTDEQQ